jgi:hypothetical protein
MRKPKAEPKLKPLPPLVSNGSADQTRLVGDTRHDQDEVPPWVVKLMKAALIED